ncbi:MAG: hypothetical protein ACFCUN_03680 [Hyphomicrobiaceae bacterium]
MTTIRTWAAALAVAPLLLIGGCVDSIELNGGVFDALGVSTRALEANKGEATVEARPGIVMPPDPTRLPPPGSGIETAALPPGASWPVGPEEAERQRQAAIQAQHDAYCAKALAEERLRGQDTSTAEGPLGSCNPGLGERILGARRPADPNAR